MSKAKGTQSKTRVTAGRRSPRPAEKIVCIQRTHGIVAGGITCRIHVGAEGAWHKHDLLLRRHFGVHVLLVEFLDIIMDK